MIVYVLLFVSSLILVAACSSKLAGWLNVPVLLFYLLVGMLARWRFGGSFAAAGSSFEANINITAYIVGSVALAFILFAGGVDTKWRGVRPILFRGGLLASVGVALTAALTGAFTFMLPGGPYSFVGCLLLGAIISSTDAAAVFAILRSRGVALRDRLQNLLEFESGSNDPMAAFLTIFLITMLTGDGGGSYWAIVPELLLRMGVGITGGFLCGRLMVRLFNKIDLEYDGLYYVLGIGTVLFAYSVAEIAHGNGFMAVYVCGMTVGNSKFMFRNSFARFHDGIGWLMQVVLFTALGFLVDPGSFGEVWGRAVAVALFLMFVARPAAVLLCMLWSPFSWRERLFVSWVGLRGGAPIMLATIPLVAFGATGDAPVDVNLVFSVVFLIVILSVLIQGKTLMPLAYRLGLDMPLRARPRTPLEFDYTDALKGEMHEFEVTGKRVGKRLTELGLPKGALVLLIRRAARYIVPHGNTVLEAGDALMILAEEPVLMQVWDVLDNSTEEEKAMETDVVILNTSVLDLRSADFAFTGRLAGAGGLALCETADMPPYTQDEVMGYIAAGKATAGGGGNTAPLLAHAGLRVAVGSNLGKGDYDGLDAQGRAFYDILTANGVDMSATLIHPTLPTGTTFIHEAPHGERGGIAYFPNANNDFDFETFKQEVLRLSPKVVYYMYSGLSKRGDADNGRDLADFVVWCRQQGHITIVDSHTLCGNPQDLIERGEPVPAYKLLEPLLGELDIFFTSVDEARMIRNTLDHAGCDRGEDTQASIRGFLDLVKDRFTGRSGRPQLFGVTLKNGAYALYADAQGNTRSIAFHASNYMAGRVVDLVGAGDSFRAGLIGYITRNRGAFLDGTLNVAEAVQSGNLMASIYVTSPLNDRYGSIPKQEALLAIVRDGKNYTSEEELKRALRD